MTSPAVAIEASRFLSREPELIARVVAGDRQAARELYDAHAPRVFRLAAPSRGPARVSGGTAGAEIIKVYDETTDTQLKDAVMSALVESGEKQATDKLMQIARMDESSQMRRKAISILSRSSDERVKKFLSDIAER